MRHRCLALSLLALALGCSQDERPATAVAFTIKTDLSAEELSAVALRIYPADADLRAPEVLARFEPQPLAALARPTVVTKGGRSEFIVSVQGLGPGGESDPVIEQLLRVRFVDGQTIVAPVFLSRACFRKACGAADQTCYGQPERALCEGSCGPIPDARSRGVVESPSDPALSGGWTPERCDAGSACDGESCDAGVACDGGGCDAGVTCDGGSCGAPACDGGACETCTPSLVPGATCNVYRQCGCPTGQSCMIWRIDEDGAELRCGTPTGTKPVGEACSFGECGPGLVCVGNPSGVCRPLCETDAQCGGGRGSCAVMNDADSDDPRPTGLFFCALTGSAPP